jgi:hypothetical protein
MKKRTLGMIIGVSAISGGIILGGKLYSLAKASSEIAVVSPATKGREYKFSLANSTQSSAGIIAELTKTGEITESQARVILAFEEKIIAITNEQKSDSVDKQRLARHVVQLQADLLRFIKGENLEKILTA